MPYQTFEVYSNFAPSFERQSKQIVKHQKKNVWQYINSSKTLLWPTSPTVKKLLWSFDSVSGEQIRRAQENIAKVERKTKLA